MKPVQNRSLRSAHNPQLLGQRFPAPEAVPQPTPNKSSPSGRTHPASETVGLSRIRPVVQRAAAADARIFRSPTLTRTPSAKHTHPMLAQIVRDTFSPPVLLAFVSTLLACGGPRPEPIPLSHPHVQELFTYQQLANSQSMDVSSPLDLDLAMGEVRRQLRLDSDGTRPLDSTFTPEVARVTPVRPFPNPLPIPESDEPQANVPLETTSEGASR